MGYRIPGRAAGGIVALRCEGTALFALAAFLLARDFGTDIHNRALLGVLAGFAALVGGFLFAAANLIGRGRRWPITPTMLVQFFIFIVAFYLLKAGRAGYGLPLLLVSCVTAWAVLRLVRTAGAGDGD